MLVVRPTTLDEGTPRVILPAHCAMPGQQAYRPTHRGNPRAAPVARRPEGSIVRKVYNLPPGWPAPSSEWTPDLRWEPNPEWSKPAGWQLWVDVPDTALIGEGAVVVDVPDEEARKQFRRKPLLILGGVAATVVVFLFGIAAGGGPGAAAVADAEASASAASSAAAAERAEAQTQTEELAGAQEALEAAETQLATDQKSLTTLTAGVTQKAEKVKSREAAVKSAETDLETRESDVADRETAVETAEAAGTAEEQPAVEEPAAEEPEDTGGAAYYENCDAARADGAAPVHTGDPGYGSHLDRDGDGVGCE